MSTKDIKSAQWRDKDLIQKTFTKGNKIPSSTHTGLQKCFLVDGILCRKWFDHGMTHAQIVVPSSMKDTVLKRLRDNSGHFVKEKQLAKSGNVFTGLVMSLI